MMNDRGGMRPRETPVVQDPTVLEAVRDFYGLDRAPESMTLDDVRGLFLGGVRGRFMAGMGQVIGDANTTGNVKYYPYVPSITSDNGVPTVEVDVNTPSQSLEQVFERIVIRLNRQNAASSYHWCELWQVLEDDTTEVLIWAQELKTINLGYQADYPHYLCLPCPVVIPRNQTCYYWLYMQQNTIDVRIHWIGRQGFSVNPTYGFGTNTQKTVGTTIG